MKNLYKVSSALILIACIASMQAGTFFDTINVLKGYAQNNPESVPLANLDYLSPDYIPYLHLRFPTVWDKALMAVGLKHKSEWNPHAFIDLMHRVTEARKKNGMQGDFVQRQEVSKDDHFLIWTNLQGAFHSLVYTLEHLIEQKIIDKDLKFIAPKYFMVFSGNVIDRSVYSLETLSIVLQLLEKNPTRVFYVRGDHETNNKWQDYDLRDELEFLVARRLGMMPPYVAGEVPFTKDLNAFFDTLPVALYLGMKTVDSADGIRISYFSRTGFELKYDDLMYVLNATDKAILPLPIQLPKEREKEILGEIIAMTEGSTDLIPNYIAAGVNLLPSDKGTTAWDSLSAQTDCYQKLYNFMRDSYVDVTIALPLKNTTITQHYQDLPARTGFKTGRIYNMFSGQSAEQFNAQSKIDIIHTGTTIDLTDQAAMLGRQIRQGLALAINQQNQEGIVPGHIIMHALLNDGHVLSVVRRNIEMLVQEYQAKILLCIEENVMAKKYFDLITKNDVLVLFPFSGVAKFRSPEYPNIIHYGPSYQREAEISTRYILDAIAVDKIAIFYEKGEMGEDALAGVRTVCKEKGFTSLIEIPFMSNALDFKNQIEIIKRENPGVVGVFSPAEVGQEFLRQIGAQNLGHRTLYGLSSFGAQTFRQYYHSKGLRIITTNLVPDPYKSDLAIAQEYRKLALANNVIISPQLFEAYIAGSLFVEALRIIKGPINNQSIRHTLESMKDYDFKGLKFTFDSQNRRMSDAVWLDLGNGEEWKPFKAENSANSKNNKQMPSEPKMNSVEKKVISAPAPVTITQPAVEKK